MLLIRKYEKIYPKTVIFVPSYLIHNVIEVTLEFLRISFNFKRKKREQNFFLFMTKREIKNPKMETFPGGVGA
jgi:hypothetical protein